MKSMLIIGLGDFGHHLCRHLVKMKNEVMIIDKDEEALEDLLDISSTSMIADCTQKGVLERVGVSNFDIVFVCIGTYFKNALLTVSKLKDLGAKYVVCQTDDEMLEKFLLNNGANEVIHPNRDSAVRAAVKYSSEHIFDYLHLKRGYAIYEITPLPEWVDKTILESEIRTKYNIYIVGINSANDETTIMPSPQAVIQKTDRLMILANEDTVEKLLGKLEK